MIQSFYLIGWVASFVLLALSIGLRMHRSRERTVTGNLLKELRKTVDLEIDAVRQENADLRGQLDGARNRADSLFASADSVVKECTEWRRRYYEQSLQAGNAQALMMATLEQLAAKCQALGGKVEIPRIIQAVRSEYVTQHVQPAIAGLQAMDGQRPAVIDTERSDHT